MPFAVGLGDLHRRVVALGTARTGQSFVYEKRRAHRGLAVDELLHGCSCALRVVVVVFLVVVNAIERMVRLFVIAVHLLRRPLWRDKRRTEQQIKIGFVALLRRVHVRARSLKRQSHGRFVRVHPRRCRGCALRCGTVVQCASPPAASVRFGRGRNAQQQTRAGHMDFENALLDDGSGARRREPLVCQVHAHERRTASAWR